MFNHENRILFNKGVYEIIRHPRYLGRGFIAIGIGIIANNILAISVALIHFLVFCSLIIPEDNELLKRFGNEFIKYKKNVPMFIPKFGNWRKFIKFIFTKKNI
jgi:protein-S-isoprenylcysteine O-methyltransferase Ste14